jgi:hypothetical protein
MGGGGGGGARSREGSSARLERLIVSGGAPGHSGVRSAVRAAATAAASSIKTTQANFRSQPGFPCGQAM